MATKKKKKSFADQVIAGEYESVFTKNKEKKKSYADKVVAGEYQSVFDKTKQDIAPVRTTVTKPEERTWFQAGGFSDGYDFGDVTKTILGTTGDVGLGVTKGVFNLAEGIVDLGRYGVSGVANVLGAKEYAKDVKKTAQENTTEKWFSPLEKKIDKYSVIGEKGDTIPEGLGYVGGMIATGGLGGAIGGAIGGTTKAVQLGATLGTTGTTFTSAFGSGMSEAYKGGASDEEAVTYGAISGIAEAGTELIFGGLGKTIKAVGLNTGLIQADDMLAKKVSEVFKSQVAKNIAETGVKMGAEGTEEVIAGILQAIGQKVTYKSEEELMQLINDQELLESFISGAVVSGIAQAPSVIKDTKAGVDYVTGYTQQEQQAIDKVVNERITEQERQGITLTNKEKNAIIEQTTKEFNEFKEKVKEIAPVKDDVRSQDIAPVQQAGVQDQAPNERQQNYVSEAKETDSVYRKNLNEDASKYANNSKRTHEFVNTLSNVSESLGVNIRLTNNTSEEMVARRNQLIENYAKKKNVSVEEATTKLKNIIIDGYKTDDGIVINVDSPKALNRLVGHELTHVLEKTGHYKKLQKIALDFAKTRKDYIDTLEIIESNYDGVDYNGKMELTADIVGDYLFSDKEFIRRIQREDRNLFQRIYDEIKHLIKLATANSKEARQLEQLKYEFEKAMQEQKSDKTNKVTVQETKSNSSVEVESNTQEKEETVQKVEEEYSISKDNKDRDLSEEQIEFFKDSKVRDEDGNLLTVYHGTKSEFYTFNNNLSGDNYEGWSYSGKGFYFTDDIKEAQEFGDYSLGDNDTQIKEVYLNITNPFDTSTTDASVLEKLSEGYDVDNQALIRGDFLLRWFRSNKINASEVLQKNGYDGVMDYGHYLAYDSNQIKEVTNKKPTLDDDIRYSLSNIDNEDNDGVREIFLEARETLDNLDLKALREYITNQRPGFFSDKTDNLGRILKKGMKNYMKDSKARDINDSLTTVYHTTTDRIPQFNEFNPVGTPGYRFGNQVVNYYTNSKDMSGSYADQDYEMADTKKVTSLVDARKLVESSTDGEVKIKKQGDKYQLVGSESKVKAYEEAKAVYDTINYSDKDFMYNLLAHSGMKTTSRTEQINDFFNIVKKSQEANLAFEYIDFNLSEGAKEYFAGMIGHNYKVPKSVYKTYDNENHLLRNIRADIDYLVNGENKIQYEGYVNITNPYVVDAEARSWKRVGRKFNDNKQEDLNKITSDQDKVKALEKLANDSWKRHEEYDFSGDEWTYYHYKNTADAIKGRELNDAVQMCAMFGFEYNEYAESHKTLPSELVNGNNTLPSGDTTVTDLTTELTETNYNMFKDMTLSDFVRVYAQEYEKNMLYGKEDSYFKHEYKNITGELKEFPASDLYKIARKHFTEDSITDAIVEYSSTNDVVKQVIEMNKNGANYDGVIIKNVFDYGGETNVEYYPADLYVTFNSNQFKAWDNENPTDDNDIRYSLSDTKEYDYQSMRPKVRGGWTIEKIQKQLKQEQSSRVTGKDFAEFTDINELMDNIYYHGSISYHENLKAGSTLPEEARTGGYGQEYHTISLSKSKNIASNFSSMGANGVVTPVLLKKGANVIEMPDIEDSIELEDMLPELWEQKVDAVKIGDWDIEKVGYGEQEIVILNPRAIATIGKGATYYRNYKKPKFENLNEQEIIDLYEKYNQSSIDDLEYRMEQLRNREGTYARYEGRDAEAQAQMEVYQKQLEGVRQRVGKFDAQYSLSRTTDDIAPVKDTDVFGRDIAVQEAIAPLQEKVEELTKVITDLQENIAPASLETAQAEGDRTLQQMTDEDAPVDEGTFTFLDNEIEVKKKQEIVNEIASDFNIKKTEARELYNKIDSIAEPTIEDIVKELEAYREIKFQEEDDYVKSIQDYIRGTRLDVSEIKQQIPDYGNKYRMSNMGKGLILGNSGQKIDSFYQELSELYPNEFPSTVTAEADQLELISDAMYKEKEFTYTDIIDDDELQILAERIYSDIGNHERYRHTQSGLYFLNKELKNMTPPGEVDNDIPVASNTKQTEDIAPVGKKSFEEIAEKFLERKRAKQTDTATPKTENNTPRIEKSKYRNFRDTTQRLFVNEMVETDNLAKETGNLNIKFKGDMLNSVAGEIEGEIQIAQTDNEGHAIGKSLSELFAPAKEKGLYDAFNDYLEHYSNIDRHAQGKGSKTPLNVSQTLVKAYEKSYPEFKQWGKDVWKYGANVRDNLIDAGIISEEHAEALGTMYPHYVPYMENREMSNYNPDLGEIKPKGVIKRAKGGAKNLLPIEDALTKYTFGYKKAVRQNQFYQEIVKTLGPGVDVGADVRNDAIDFEDTLYKDETGNYLTAYVDGERISTRITDDLYTGLKNDLSKQIKGLEEKYALITEPVQKLSEIRRNLLTSWNPMFIIKNPIMDVQDALFNSKYTKDFMKNYPGAFIELGKANTETARQFLTLYGSGNVMGEHSADGTVKKSNFLKGIQRANNVMELAPRYAEFKASLENGASIQEAMYNAREVTTNFSRGGTITKALNRNGFTFLNVSVQGFDKLIRNFGGENGAKGFTGALLKATLLGVVPALFNDLLFGGDDEDEEYEALPDYIKDNYYLIKTGEGEFIRIPKGRMLSVFGSAGRRTLEFMQGEEDAFEGFLKNANSQVGISNPLDSNILTPLIQAYGSENGEAWYGGDLVPSRLQKKAPEEQYDATTDKMSIWLGDKLGISPYKLNYVLDQYSGGIGDIFLPFITEEATSDAEGLGMVLAPIKDQFTVNSTSDNKYAGEIYDLSDKMDKMPEATKETDEYKVQDAYLYSVTSEMGKLYEERRKVQADKNLSKSEKYKKVQAIQKQINDLAKEGMENYQNVSKTDNYAIVGGREFNKYTTDDGTERWGSVFEDVLEDLNSLGMDLDEKSEYFKATKTISSVQDSYKGSDDFTGKKQEVIGVIKGTNLTGEQKAYLYDKYYGNSDVVEAMVNLNVDIDSFLDYEAQDFTADKYANGKTVPNSKKRKVFEYINSMPIEFEQRLILTKLQYPSYNEYNPTIIEYLNNSDMTYEQVETLLTKMDFKVDENGRIFW